MKNLFTFILCLAISSLVFAQENEQENDYQKTGYTPFHEVKINAGLLFLGNVNLTYEHLLNDESAVGGSLSIPFDDIVNWDLNFSATGFYRFYFGEGYAKGFYAEAFGMFNNYEENLRKGPPEARFREKENVSDFAIGLGGGYKLVSKTGVTLEFHLGIGRNFFNYGLDGRSYNFVPRGGVHVGYRF